MAGTFACPSANSLCHKHFTRACPSSGKKRMVCYFYLRKTGLPPKDIRNCPPCEYLIDNSLPAYVAADGGSGAVTPAWSRNYDPDANKDINNNTAKWIGYSYIGTFG
eukprot:scaffold35423_cov36-Cyclotella_meneghiniana.AAC.1